MLVANQIGIHMLIKTAAIVLLALVMTGCASGCREACILGWGPGSASFDAIALAHDRADHCQGDARWVSKERRAELGRPDDYRIPNWCGAGRGSRKPTYIYNNTGQRIATVK